MPKFRLMPILLCIVCAISCGPQFQPIILKQVPIAVSAPDAEEVDVDIIIKLVEKKTKAVLPEAYFGRFGFQGTCQDLLKKQGQVVVRFIDVSRPLLVAQQDLLVTASITTSEQIMDYTIIDYSQFYLNTEGYPKPTDQQFDKIVTIAHQNITALGVSNCEVTIAQLENSWHVYCLHLETHKRACEFTIDNITYKVQEGDSEQ